MQVATLHGRFDFWVIPFTRNWYNINRRRFSTFLTSHSSSQSPPLRLQISCYHPYLNSRTLVECIYLRLIEWQCYGQDVLLSPGHIRSKPLHCPGRTSVKVARFFYEIGRKRWVYVNLRQCTLNGLRGWDSQHVGGSRCYMCGSVRVWCMIGGKMGSNIFFLNQTHALRTPPTWCIPKSYCANSNLTSLGAIRSYKPRDR